MNVYKMHFSTAWFSAIRLPMILKMFILFGVVSSFIIIPMQQCFGEIGCIVVDGDFYDKLRRPLNPTPLPRDIINVSYTVFSREDPEGTVISAQEVPEILNTAFKIDRKTKILIHGFLDSEGQAFYPDMTEALLNQSDVNVLTVYWGGGSMTTYIQAAINTRVVGLEIAFLVYWLVTEANVKAPDVHLIGHSLGAHIAGYAGERIQGLGRITGLDPAEPYFQDLPKRVRLDPSDATFVDVIHTDSDPIYLLGLGLAQPVGHLDFYPNDGRRQPGCQHPISAAFNLARIGVSFLDDLTPEQKSFLICSHIRSTQYFTDSIISTNCTYESFQCSSYDSFLDGNCELCGPDGTFCAKMGIEADQWPGVGQPDKENVKMYLKTGAGPTDFCLE